MTGERDSGKACFGLRIVGSIGTSTSTPIDGNPIDANPIDANPIDAKGPLASRRPINYPRRIPP